jgi:hypothetical protein
MWRNRKKYDGDAHILITKLQNGTRYKKNRAA